MCTHCVHRYILFESICAMGLFTAGFMCSVNATVGVFACVYVYTCVWGGGGLGVGGGGYK